MELNIQQPLRLAVGSHQAGSGKGCVMNVVSWENGDQTITDPGMCRRMNIPDGMPILSRGGHKSPTEGACIMELASFLAGEAWTDHPACVHPHLASAARGINDDLSKEDRQRLLPLLPRLMGTSEDVGDVVILAAAQYVEHLAGHEDGFVANCAEMARRMADKGNRVAIQEAFIAADVSGMDPVDFLSSLIDAYDEAAGRSKPTDITEADLRRCADLTGVNA